MINQEISTKGTLTVLFAGILPLLMLYCLVDMLVYVRNVLNELKTVLFVALALFRFFLCSELP